MEWDAVGAIGEIVGAIAVVATLFYLASQIRQNSRAVERSNQLANADSIHSTNTSYSNVFAQLAQDAELTSIYRRALDNEPLDKDETIRFEAFLNTYFVWLEDVHHQIAANVGFIDMAPDPDSDEFWDVVGPQVINLLNNDVGRHWWLDSWQCAFAPVFKISVDDFLKRSNIALREN